MKYYHDSRKEIQKYMTLSYVRLNDFYSLGKTASASHKRLFYLLRKPHPWRHLKGYSGPNTRKIYIVGSNHASTENKTE